MTTSSGMGIRGWTEILGNAVAQQVAMARATYEAIAQLGEAERSGRLLELETALYKLDDAAVRAFTKVRFDALLSMDAALARSATAPYPALLDKLPGPSAMRHVAFLQTVAREYSQEDQARLKVLFPEALAAKADARPKPAASQPAGGGGRAWWAFWKKAA
jgi:hypothetical protein